MISPGKACNLRCGGCYANSGAHREKLDWATFERTVREAHDTWGTRVFVISGGEPLAWRDGGRSFLDLAERFPDCFFVMYTNGTLIDDAVAKRMGRLGNVSPALSIEGMKERTDARRGDGVFDKVLAAMERLRREGVIIGVSLTATRENSDEILSDEVVETFFDGIGASYAFVFHYMPIGRSFTLDLMMTPEQRLRLFERVWWLVRNRHIFIADFWNSATATNGCLAAGRAGGYFHVNWNGDVSPCVFFPYSPVNVREVFARGGTLDEVWAHPFFADIRRWQRDYGYREANEPCPDCGNWLAPCIIRDHHSDFLELVRRHEPAPTRRGRAGGPRRPRVPRGARAVRAGARGAHRPGVAGAVQAGEGHAARPDEAAVGERDLAGLGVSGMRREVDASRRPAPGWSGGARGPRRGRRPRTAARRSRHGRAPLPPLGGDPAAALLGRARERGRRPHRLASGRERAEGLRAAPRARTRPGRRAGSTAGAGRARTSTRRGRRCSA